MLNVVFGENILSFLIITDRFSFNYFSSVLVDCTYLLVVTVLQTLVAYAVGQSLSTRPDIIGSEISKVR